MENFEITNYDRVEKLLLEINATKKNLKTTKLPDNKVVTQFAGKLGADVSYTGEVVRLLGKQNEIPRESTYRDIRIAAHGELLAIISAKNALTDGAQKRKSVRTNSIWVISPQCKEDGVDSKSIEALNQLHVLHAPDETADSVIDHICDEIAYSKAKVAYDKKYTHLNIATKLADLSQEKEIKASHTTKQSKGKAVRLTDQMTNDFNSVFNDDKDSVPLPQVNATKEPQHHCNLRKEEWAYHNKLTKQTVNNIQSLKNDAVQNKDDRTTE